MVFPTFDVVERALGGEKKERMGVISAIEEEIVTMHKKSRRTWKRKIIPFEIPSRITSASSRNWRRRRLRFMRSLG